MADSSSINPRNLIEQLQRDLDPLITPGDRLTLALSGGVDSVVLLDILVRLAATIGFHLSAVHVNHGISRNADQWSCFCQKLCQDAAIPLSIFHLQIQKQAQQSLEAVARDARYQVFAQLDTDYIVLAQHQDDQVETLLLQMLRGAGVKGLSAMPSIRPLAGTSIKLLRPLLNIPRSTLLHYAQVNDLSWVDDESNTSIDFDRNYLRHQVLPAIEARYPAYRKTLSRTCRHLGEAVQLLDELARIDGEQAIDHAGLSQEKLRKLDPARAKNLLRYFLSQKIRRLPSTARLDELLRQLCAITPDNHLSFRLENVEIRCFQGRIECLPVTPATVKPFVIPWRGEKQLFIEPLQGTLLFTEKQGVGIDLRKLLRQTVTIRPRLGGEKFRLNFTRPRRSLKKILQEAAFPPWKRNTLPLLFSADILIWVAGIGVDCHFQAPPDAPGLEIIWLPDSHCSFHS